MLTFWITHQVSPSDFACVACTEMATMCFVSYNAANTVEIIRDDIIIIENDGNKYSCIERVEEEVSLFEMGDSKTSAVFVNEPSKLESLESVVSYEGEYEEEADEENKNDAPKDDKKVLDQQDTQHVDFARKVWTAFLTFHVFIIPAIIGMVLGVLTKCENDALNSPYKRLESPRRRFLEQNAEFDVFTLLQRRHFKIRRMKNSLCQK
ncbi:uncharacterized protein TNCV_1257061 [Trichonephila clavipes]|nr:uncharacterized protein TNCV_1257061 [Trichonephila clavipes]